MEIGTFWDTFGLKGKKHTLRHSKISTCRLCTGSLLPGAALTGAGGQDSYPVKRWARRWGRRTSLTPDGIFPCRTESWVRRRRIPTRSPCTRAYKKHPRHFYLSIYYFFFSKEIHAKGKRKRETERERHGNHVLAAKHRKIIWHNLSVFFFFFAKRRSTLPLKFTFLKDAI